MSGWVLDVVITLLLIAAAGFGAIAVIGLLLFPDIRSRSFTGLRAGILATALVTLVGICYGIFAWASSGYQQFQYLEYALGAVVILVLVIVLNRVATGVLCHASVPPRSPEEKGQA